MHPDSVVPRFRGDQAPLAALAAQVRTAAGDADKASAAGRLARQLVKRDIEIREAIALAEKSLSLQADAELALDLAAWWAASGDLIRGAALLQSGAESLPLERRLPIVLEVARLHARSGQVLQAVQALRYLMSQSREDAAPFELHGSLGFWAEIPAAECAKSYLQAAQIRKAQGQDGPAFENRLRAFEVDPASSEAANELASALRERGRPGAADEILREHLRRGSAAGRAAHHQRVFFAALGERNWARALESALEAFLDIELDPTRLEEVLRQGAKTRGVDFESFLTMLAREGALGHADLFADWLISLVDLHIADWGEERVNDVREKVATAFHVQLPARLDAPLSDSRLRELRQSLAAEKSDEERQLLRKEIARREAARGAWSEALDAFEPLFSEQRLSLSAATLGAVIAGRARAPRQRAEALALLGAALPGTASAVAYAVAAEMLLAQGDLEGARRAATAAVDAEPSNERAVASQALVALRAPEQAAAGLLERSLSVLVARSEACSILCRSASERGAHRLALTWAARSFSLRPGEIASARAYLHEARLTGEADKLAEALSQVLEQAAPFAALAEDIARALSELHQLPAESFQALGARVLSVLGVRSPAVVDALIASAKSAGASKLLAAITERQLVVTPRGERSPFSLALCRQRLSAEQPVAAARALRRAIAQGANVALVEELLGDFSDDIAADGALALQEVRVELMEIKEPEKVLERAEALRHVGAARWDMAQDAAGAIQLWLRAADLQPEGGLELFALYLRQIAGAEIAAKRLCEVAKQTEDPTRSGKLLGLAARELFEVNEKGQAFELARDALHRAPLLTDLLAVAEASANADQIYELLHLYDLLAEASLGSYGERALHYRAARQLEKRGLPEKALEHACSAFEAVPAEGVAFVLMARLADSTAGHGALIASLQKVADAASNDDERARWLAKAAAMADTDSMGRRERAELLLRAAQMMPEKETLDALLDALAHFLADEPAALDEMWERFRLVAVEVLRHATGAHGAELNLLFASAATTHFDQAEFSLECLNNALDCNTEVPEYGKLVLLANQLAGLPEPALAFVDKAKSSAFEQNRPLGRGLAELAGKIAFLLGDAESETNLLVRAASDSPEDAELVALAKKAAERDGRVDLIELIQSLLPVTERAHFVLERLDSLQNQEALDALLDLDLDAAEPQLRARILEALGDRQEAVGLSEEAGVSYRELVELEPENLVALKGVERDADRSGNYEELVRILKLRAELSSDVGEVRRLHLRRAAVLETRLGRARQAREVLLEMADKDEDRSALRMLADSWERTGDHTEAAELWGRVQAVAADQLEADDSAFRAASCFVEAGTPRRAAEALATIKVPAPAYRRLSLEVARELGEPEEIRKHLIGLAEVTTGDSAQAGALFLEAARLALSAGEARQAESCARRAQEALPKSAEIRLLVASLSVRRSTPKSKEQGARLLEMLEGTEELTGATDRELSLFLRAQALRAVESDAAALKLLEEAVESQGERPLLALGLAELLRDAPERALGLYESAVGGELHGFRGEGEVLLAAAELSRELGEYARARAFASAVADEDSQRARAAQALEEIALEEARSQREAREAAEREAVQAKEQAEAEAAVEVQKAEEKAAAESQRAEALAAAQKEAAAEREAVAAAARAQSEKAAAERAEQEKKAADAAAEQEQREAAAEARREERAAESERLESIRNAAREEHRQATQAASEHAELAPVGEIADPLKTGSLRPEKLPEIEEDEFDRALASLEPTQRESETVEAPPVAPQSTDAEDSLDAPLPAADLLPEPPFRDDEMTLDAPAVAPTEEAAPPTDDDVPPPSQEAPPPLYRSVTPAPASVAPKSSRPPSRHPPKTDRSDEELVAALENGQINDGLELLERLQADRSRARDAVVVAQHLAALDPGDASLLGRLVTTASRDGNEALALAVRHVLGCYGSGDPVDPPELERLADQGGAARALLVQSCTPAHEALALVWEHANGLFRKGLEHYGVSGLERVPLNSPTPLGELYQGAARVLGMTRTAVFRKTGQGDIAMQIALLSPPAVLVAGDIHYQSPELRFHFGAMLAAAAPEHALLFGASPQEIQSLLDALALSFGAGSPGGSRPSPEVTRLASYFWETIPARAQRRLSQLCSDPSLLSVKEIMAASRLTLRRAGLIVCGDLRTAVEDACVEAGLEAPHSLSGLADCAAAAPVVADLLGLALSPEYAELRFRAAR